MNNEYTITVDFTPNAKDRVNITCIDIDDFTEKCNTIIEEKSIDITNLRNINKIFHDLTIENLRYICLCK